VQVLEIILVVFEGRMLLLKFDYLRPVWESWSNNM